MEKKTKKKRVKLRVVLCIACASIVFCIIDSIRATNRKSPIFCLPYSFYKDGGTTHYIGLGYSIFKDVNEDEYWDKNNQDDGFDYQVNFLYFIPVKVYDCTKN